MAGGVWEWTADWYDNYGPQGARNPQGPASGTTRVFRGGGWRDTEASLVRAGARSGCVPGDRAIDLGLRCARSQ